MYLKAINGALPFLRDLFITTGKKLPHARGGAPRKIGTFPGAEKYQRRNHSSASPGTKLTDIYTRLAQRYGVSPSKIKQIWLDIRNSTLTSRLASIITSAVYGPADCISSRQALTTTEVSLQWQLRTPYRTRTLSANRAFSFERLRHPRPGKCWSLLLHDGVADVRRTIRLPRVNHGLKRLVMIGSDGFITLEALRWLADQGGAFVMLDRRARCSPLLARVSPSDARLRRAQALALGNGQRSRFPKNSSPRSSPVRSCSFATCCTMLRQQTR